jgi:hypothetical protein
MAFSTRECLELADRGYQCDSVVFSFLSGSALPRHVPAGFLLCYQFNRLVALAES